MRAQPVVLVGVAVFVYHGDEFLIGLRKGSHGAGTWGLPGGHLEYGEMAKQAAFRELLEETNLEIEAQTLKHAGFSEAFFEHKHYVTLVMTARCKNPSGLRLMEPEKCAEWRWVRASDLDGLPLYPPLKNYLQNNLL